MSTPFTIAVTYTSERNIATGTRECASQPLMLNAQAKL